MATRKRAAKKAPAKKTTKRTNSNIAAAQQATKSTRARQEAARRARVEGALSERDRQNDPKAAADAAKLKAAQEFVKPGQKQPVLEQNVGGGRTSKGADPGKSVTGMGEAANKIAGLASGIMDERKTTRAATPPSPLADASKYGSTDNAARAARVTLLLNAQNAAANKKLTDAGKAVWMGARYNRAKIRNQGPERLDPEGNNRNGGLGETTNQAVGDDIRSTDELMSWLADEKTFNQIRDAAKKAGMDVQSYDDVAKLWEQVVKQAAATYSTTGKKVTPWALLQLRGKTMVNGKPAAKTTTSTSVEEMDPAQAKVMVKNALQQALGRDPQQSEIDDFISKAQMIAKSNPNVTTTTTQYGFDGNPVSQSSTSRGGTDVVSAKAQLEAEAMAKAAPDYAEYQTAGVLMPWFNEALASPF